MGRVTSPRFTCTSTLGPIRSNDGVAWPGAGVFLKISRTNSSKTEQRRITLLYELTALKKYRNGNETFCRKWGFWPFRALNVSCAGWGSGCTIVYTGAWLGWKCFLVKVF